MRDLTKAENYELEELIDDVVPRYQQSSNNGQQRMKELFLAEKELKNARAMLASWEIFRNGISEQYPELLKWCPPISVTIHDPELTDVVIYDSVKS